MANWLRGGFEMDRKGDWRLKPQVADTLQRDVQAIMAQAGWERNISRSAQDQTAFGISVKGEIGGGVASSSGKGKSTNLSNSITGRSGGSIGLSSQEIGTTNEVASSQLNIVNYDVRQSLANAERSAARSSNPNVSFSDHLSEEILGSHGLRNRYLGSADSRRGTTDISAPLTSLEQSSILKSGGFSNDLDRGPHDGDSSFKTRD